MGNRYVVEILDTQGEWVMEAQTDKLEWAFRAAHEAAFLTDTRVWDRSTARVIGYYPWLNIRRDDSGR